MISAHKTDKYGATRRQDLNDGRPQVRREETQWLDRVVRAVGIGHFIILLIVASNLGATKSIAPCEATEPG